MYVHALTVPIWHVCMYVHALTVPISFGAIHHVYYTRHKYPSADVRALVIAGWSLDMGQFQGLGKVAVLSVCEVST